MEDLHEKLDIISKVVSDIGVRLDKFESDIGIRLDNFEGRVVSFERVITENRTRIDSFETRGCPSHKNRVSHVNAAFQDEPGEKENEPAKRKAWTEEPVELDDSPAPGHSGKTKNIYHVLSIYVRGR